ncbi:branched-chain amino acid ABC transporter substrate-binding protein [Candidatus Atribacteria bacterium 1244-E10-H5-B2]|nr:MAG: branched-chain amino acid ABC transporter substrate-binding protein [Candidatus Atribacteria bacterium 1244-E10-H5-B2]
MKKILISVMLISILLFSLVGDALAQENIIKIGAAVSLTGKMAYEGRLVKEGYEVWEDWVNNHGGITAGGKNYRVKMIYYDDESAPVRGAKLTEKLITQNKVDFLFGPFSSSITFATTAIGEKYGKITIAPEANATKIYERGYKYVFSVLPPAPMLMVPIAYMAENLDPKPKTVAIIVANDLFPLSCAEGFRDKCKELGFEVVLFEKYPAGATDISTLLTKVKNLNPDILADAGYTADSLMVMRQCKELNINPQMYAFSVGVMIPTFIEELGADAEFAFEGEWWLPGMKNSDKVFGTTADYVQACKDKFGPDYMPEYHVSSASTAGILLQLAIEKADSIETDKVRDALASLDLELSTWPAIAFNEKGQNIKWPHPVIQVQNGKYIIVYPESSQENAPIYPAAEWKKR